VRFHQKYLALNISQSPINISHLPVVLSDAKNA
jgi:hypothetical protein